MLRRLRRLGLLLCRFLVEGDRDDLAQLFLWNQREGGADGQVNADAHHVNRRSGLLLSSHGKISYFERSTVMANLVMPSTFARSMTWTTSPCMASRSAVRIKFESLFFSLAFRNSSRSAG